MSVATFGDATVPVEMLTRPEGSFPKWFVQLFSKRSTIEATSDSSLYMRVFFKISVLCDHTALNRNLLPQLPQCSCTMFSCEVVTGHRTRFETEATGPPYSLRILVDRFLSGLVHHNSGEWIFISQLNRETTIEKVVVHYWAGFLQT